MFLSYFDEGLYEIGKFIMDTTQIFYSRPSYLSSFKVYYPNEKGQPSKSQFGGYKAPNLEKAAKNFAADVVLPFTTGLAYMIGEFKRKN